MHTYATSVHAVSVRQGNHDMQGSNSLLQPELAHTLAHGLCHNQPAFVLLDVADIGSFRLNHILAYTT